jgi:hypothetical protein
LVREHWNANIADVSDDNFQHVPPLLGAES